MHPTYAGVMPGPTTPTRNPRGTARAGHAGRAGRAAVVAALVAPWVVLAHLLTRGEAPGAAGLLAVTGLVGLAALLAPAVGTARLTLAVVVAQTAGHGALAALTPGTGGGCLPAVGRGAEAGLHLALLRPDASCPTGLTAGPTLTALLGSVLTAVALVAGQVLVAALSARAAEAAGTAARALRALLAAVLPALPAAVPAVPPAAPAAVRGEGAAHPRPAAAAPQPLTRRGPPRALPAAAAA